MSETKVGSDFSQHRRADQGIRQCTDLAISGSSVGHVPAENGTDLISR